MSLEARRDQLNEFIQAEQTEEEEVTASAILFFGGKPVAGTLGIESEFATAAVSQFQDLVAKVLAQKSGTLAQRGPLPKKSSSKLHITNIARGSVGFILEEINPQSECLDTSLKTAVHETTELLDVFSEWNESQFQEAIETIDQRVLGSVAEFFNLMRRDEATLRVVADDADHSFGVEAVSRAADRALTTTTEDAEELVTGQLAGVLPDAHRFEFRTNDARGVIAGRVDQELDPDELARFNREWVNLDAQVLLNVKKLFRNDVVVRESYTLLRLAPPPND